MHGGRRSAVSFEFHDRDTVKRVVAFGAEVVKTQAGIDRQAFGHAAIDERNSRKIVFEMRRKLFGRKIRMFCQKTSRLIRMQKVLIRFDFDPLFICSAAIILILDLKK